MTNRITPRRRARVGTRVLTVGAVVLATAALAACSGGTPSGGNSYGFNAAKQSKSVLTVWVDSPRVAAAKAFETANPNVKIKIVSYDGSANGSNSFKTKMQLFDRAGKGWPDVVFASGNNDASWASQATSGKQAFAAVLDKGLVPSATIKGFAKGSLNPCTVSGSAYCLRNDLAQNVVWYDKTLLTQFGYAVPTTWEQYEALGAKVAQEHPGYVIGSVGDSFASEIYFWGSKCEANGITGAKTVTVNVTSSNCTRAASLIDSGIANGSISTLSLFSPDFVQKYSGKVLALVGPSWYGGAVYNSKTGLNLPAGHLAVAAPLKWGTDSAVTGDVGGATWFISSHSTNLAAASSFLQFVTTSDAYQVKLAPTYPAYTAAAKAWVVNQEASGYYATDLSELVAAAPLVWSGWGSGSFSQEAIWASTMTSKIAAGSTVLSLLPTWGDAIKNQAQVEGYRVN